MSAIEQHAARLQEAGIDPESFVKVVGQLGEEYAAHRERLFEFAREVHGAGFSLYFPFESCIAPLGEVFAGDDAGFVAAVDDLSAIVTELGEEATKAVQRGVPALSHGAAEGRPWVVGGGLSAGAQLARRGVEAGETMLGAVLVLAEVVGPDRATFELGVSSVVALLLELDLRGVHPTFPIQEGICGIIRAWPDDPQGLGEALASAGALVPLAQQVEASPYGLFHHGIERAMGAAGGVSWLRDEVLPLGEFLARAGIDPTLTLADGIGAVARLEPARGRAALAEAQNLAMDGVDAGWFLAGAAGPVAWSQQDDGAFRSSLGLAADLARVIHRRGHQPLLTFQEALPHLAGRIDLDRVLRAAIALGEAGIDPGPVLGQGYGTLAEVCGETPETLEAGLELGEAFVAEGRSPRQVLGYGVPAAVRAAGPDDQRSAQIVRQLQGLLVALHGRGIDTDDLVLYGVHPMAIDATGEPERFETMLALVGELVEALAQADLPIHQAVGRGLPAVAKAADGDGAAIRGAVDFARGLAADGIDPGPLMVHALPALGLDAAGAVGELARAARRAAIDEGELGEALSRLPAGNPAGVREVLGACDRFMADGVDPVPVLRSGFPPLLEAFGEGDLSPALALLEGAIKRAAAEREGAEGLAVFAEAVEAMASNPGGLGSCLEAASRAAIRFRSGVSDVEEIFSYRAGQAARAVAKGRPEVFAGVLDELVEWGQGLADRPGFRPALGWALHGAAVSADGDPKALAALLPPLGELASSPRAAGLFEHAFPCARAAARETGDTLARVLEDLLRLDRVEPGDEHFEELGRMTRLVESRGRLWSDLVLPVASGVGAGAPVVLRCVRALERHLHSGESMALVRTIATQHGLAAPDVLIGLLATGLRQGQIRNLGEEAGTILAYLEEVPFPDPDTYVEFARIIGDPSLDAAGRAAGVRALRSSIDDLMGAIVQGEVSDEQARQPLLGPVLAHVFPPARTASRRDYVALFQAFDDRPEDLQAYLERGPLPETTVEFAAGGYRLRPGETIEGGPWETMVEVVTQVEAQPPEPVGLASLGEALFDAWIAGTLARSQTRTPLLAQVYGIHRAAGGGLPPAPEDAADHLAYRDFLSDAAREIVLDALGAHRRADPERYDERAQARLRPERRIGKGLVKAVARTLEDHRAGDLDRETAILRLSSQLRSFDLSDGTVRDGLLNAERDELAAVLDGLPAKEAETPLGQEHHRVLAELAGADLAAMGRELFGGGDAAGKLERSREGGPKVPVRFEPTKRRAHGPVGFCEGVCTATDQKLWEQPHYLQCVLWGPDGRAQGGVHLLVVERETDGGRDAALALPGINPSYALLREVGTAELVDAVLGFARDLARAWGLDEVWIPTNRSIATNRAEVMDDLEGRNLDSKQVTTVPFSYAPYRYAFERVWRVPSGEPVVTR